MRRLGLVILLVASCSAPVWAQRMSEDQERVRLTTLLEWARTNDPPSRHTAYIEMSNFGKWVEPVLLEKLNGATDQERILFLLVLRTRGVSKIREFARNRLPAAIAHCEKALITAAQIAELRRAKAKVEREGGDASAIDSQIAGLRHELPWLEITDGTEVALLCEILSTFGREDDLKLLVNLAVKSATDETLVKGWTVHLTRSRRGKVMPGGTEAWNTVYNPVWESLVVLSHRSFDKKLIASQREKLTEFFEKLQKREDRKKKLNPNQEAALKRFAEVKEALFKTESTAEPADTTDEEDTDVGIIRK